MCHSIDKVCEIFSVGDVRNEMSRVLETGNRGVPSERLFYWKYSERDQIRWVCGVTFVRGMRSETRTRV